MIEIIKKVFSKEIMTLALEQFGNVSFKYFLLYACFGLCILGATVCICRFAKKQVLISDVLTGIIFCFYLSVMIQLTLVCRESGSRIGIELDLFHGLRRTGGRYHLLMWAYAILNAMLFVPYGFLWSLYSFVDERKWYLQLPIVTIFCFMTSLGIEYTQLFTARGYFEVQDLAFNTFGGICGWGICFLMTLFVRRVKSRRRS